MIQIRRMTEEDCEMVAQIEKESFSLPWSKQAFLDTLEDEAYSFYVAEEEGKVRGYCGVLCSLDEGEIPNVCVAQDARNSGIGTRLMTALCEDAKNKGIRILFLEVRESNQPARSLYKKMLFQEDGIRRGFYSAPKEDAVLMSRVLAD